MARIYVAGATGYTGREVVRQLAESGEQVWAHIRPESSGRARWEAQFAAWGAQPDVRPWEADAMAAGLAAAAPTLVFSLLGTTASRGKREVAGGADPDAVTYDAVDRALTLMLLEAAEACGTSPRFVFLSSLGAGTPGRGAYLDARTAVEARLAESALPSLIARPSFITGEGRDDPRTSERVGAALADAGLGLLAAIGVRGPRDRYASLDNQTLAAGLIGCARAATESKLVVETPELRRAAQEGG